MISTNDMRSGMTLDLDGQLWAILEQQHHKPGKGGAVVRTKLRNLRSGAVVEKTFRADEKLELARLDKKEMQFVYREHDFVFMDNATFEQTHVPEETLGAAAQFLKEGAVVHMVLCVGSIVSVELPTTVDLVVKETDPGMKGDRVSGGTKPATLETGMQIQVPLFVALGETVRVDTRTGLYLTRVQD